MAIPTSARNSRIRATAVCTSRFSRTQVHQAEEGAVEDREPGQIGRVGLSVLGAAAGGIGVASES